MKQGFYSYDHMDLGIDVYFKRIRDSTWRLVKINCILKKFKAWNESPIHENENAANIKN